MIIILDFIAKNLLLLYRTKKPPLRGRMKKLTDKAIAESIDVDQVTFSRWKTGRPELYARIKQSFECEAKLKALGVALDDAIRIVKDYKVAEAIKEDI